MSDFETIMSAVARLDMHEEVFWTTDLKVFCKCSDLFGWGCSDAEPLDIDDLPLFEKSVNEDFIYGNLLYCCRKRSERPQGAYYKHITRKLWSLFDECGPKRDVDVGNPVKHYGDMTAEEELKFMERAKHNKGD